MDLKREANSFPYSVLVKRTYAPAKDRQREMFFVAAVYDRRITSSARPESCASSSCQCSRQHASTARETKPRPFSIHLRSSFRPTRSYDICRLPKRKSHTEEHTSELQSHVNLVCRL